MIRTIALQVTSVLLSIAVWDCRYVYSQTATPVQKTGPVRFSNTANTYHFGVRVESDLDTEIEMGERDKFDDLGWRHIPVRVYSQNLLYDDDTPPGLRSILSVVEHAVRGTPTQRPTTSIVGLEGIARLGLTAPSPSEEWDWSEQYTGIEATARLDGGARLYGATSVVGGFLVSVPSTTDGNRPEALIDNAGGMYSLVDIIDQDDRGANIEYVWGARNKLRFSPPAGPPGNTSTPTNTLAPSSTVTQMSTPTAIPTPSIVRDCVPALFSNSESDTHYDVSIEDDLDDTEDELLESDGSYFHSALDVYGRMLYYNTYPVPCLRGVYAVAENAAITLTPTYNPAIAIVGMSGVVRPEYGNVGPTTPTPTGVIQWAEIYAGVSGISDLESSDSKFAGCYCAVAGHLTSIPSSREGHAGHAQITGAAGTHSGVVIYDEDNKGANIGDAFGGRFVANLAAQGDSPNGVTIGELCGAVNRAQIENQQASIGNLYGLRARIIHTPDGTPTPFVENAYALYADVDVDPRWVSGQRLSIRGIGGRALIGPAATPDAEDYLQIFQPISDGQISPTNAKYTMGTNDYLYLSDSTSFDTWYEMATFPCPLSHAGNVMAPGTKIVSVKAVFYGNAGAVAYSYGKLELNQRAPGEAATTTTTGSLLLSYLTPFTGYYYEIPLSNGWTVDLKDYGPEKIWATVKMKMTGGGGYPPREEFRLFGLVWKLGDVKY